MHAYKLVYANPSLLFSSFLMVLSYLFGDEPGNCDQGCSTALIQLHSENDCNITEGKAAVELRIFRAIFCYPSVSHLLFHDILLRLLPAVGGVTAMLHGNYMASSAYAKSSG